MAGDDEYDFDSHESKLNPTAIDDGSGQVETGKRKVQKAVKRTMKRAESGAASASASSTGIGGGGGGSSTRRAGRGRSRVDYTEGSEMSDECDDESGVVRKFILGNIRLTCSKDQFKCVECNQTDLKSHYKYEHFLDTFRIVFSSQTNLTTRLFVSIKKKERIQLSPMLLQHELFEQFRVSFARSFE